MQPRLLEVFFYPPMAIGRLGGSNIPLESFTWQEDPTLHGAAKTIIEPAISLEIQPDGSIRPYLPSIIHFKDQNLFRPVAPFFELWARVQNSNGSIEEVPLTNKLLQELAVPLDAVSYVVEAANLKAARRTGDPTCGFSARVEVRANNSQPYPLLATSPRGVGSEPLVLPDKPIPLGHIQVIRPVDAVEMGVDLGVLRIRFTPAYGHVYGPPTATTAPAPGTRRIHEIVLEQNRILNSNSSWLNYNADFTRYHNPDPYDTYDGADVDSPVTSERSWGVVDDTCDGIITAFVVVAGERFRAVTRFFSGPPDFAPDRRPFLTLADDLADRDLPVPALDDEQLTTSEIADLFQRVFETLSLLNLDANRSRALNENAGSTIPEPVAESPPRTDFGSMTSVDKPYADKVPDLISQPVARDHLPYSAVAASVHASLTDVEALTDFLRTFGVRVEYLLRPPYGVVAELGEQPPETPEPRHRDVRIERDRVHDMRMPPYMRDSDATALSLTRRQYNQILGFVDKLRAQVPTELALTSRQVAPVATVATPVRQHIARVIARRSESQD
ncbi:MAG: hypothetical protein V7K90_22870 [Nostoc sp.]|uniref:hypothetical protein n=1 Tax=Nostoc sp. TaxID=1180 RepID=UPI002FF76126